MLERPRILHNRPDDDTLGGVPSEISAELPETIEKNVREHVDLRLRFANAVSRALDITFVDALKQYSDVYSRLTGIQPWRSEESSATWEAFAERVRTARTQEEIEDMLVDVYKGIRKELVESPRSEFWPFSYDYDDEKKTIDLHFGSLGMEPDQAEGEPGTLSKERYDEQFAKLKRMFQKIRREHPDAREVRGGSWLYNREAYRRLYPPEYTATHEIRREARFQGGGTWGQFRRKDGSVNQEARDLFYSKLDQLNKENLYDAFPLKTWLVHAPIETFYRFYGIE